MPKRSKNKLKTTHIGVILLAFLLTTVVLLSIFVWYVKTVPISGDQAASISTEPTFLYVQTAHSGSLSPEQADGKRILTLNDVSPVTVYFSKEPDRITGHEPTEEFVLEWSKGENSFSSNPPNAALDISEKNSQNIIVLELIQVKYDPQAKTLEYQVKFLDETVGTFPETFNEATLFIDSTHKDYHCDCNSSSSRTCKCKYKYTLGKSSTKEFRAYCDDEIFNDETIVFSGRKKGTSCTAAVYWQDYATRSCTNWSPMVRDEINVTVYCKHFDESIKKTDPVPHS